ncbi:MAG: T9SS type A sorting domain-containing protein, partial [Chitinophagaceae bacterium]|nr:T9SS type A sorting domain-containing protein [Chitinophagaceae bacterium]
LSFETITNKTIGDAPFIITASASSSLAVVFSASNTLININNSTVTINGAGTVRITAYQTGNNNYLPAPSFSQILTILPKNSPLTPIKNTQIQIKIYPNPAQKKLTIQQNNISQTPITLAIINLNQQLIHQQTLSFEGKTYSQINIEHIPNNTYILILSNQNQEILLIEKLQINNE